MVASSIPLAKQVVQAQSIAVPVDDDQESRFQRLVEETTMIDLHVSEFTDLLHTHVGGG